MLSVVYAHNLVPEHFKMCTDLIHLHVAWVRLSTYDSEVFLLLQYLLYSVLFDFRAFNID